MTCRYSLLFLFSLSLCFSLSLFSLMKTQIEKKKILSFSSSSRWSCSYSTWQQWRGWQRWWLYKRKSHCKFSKMSEVKKTMIVCLTLYISSVWCWSKMQIHRHTRTDAEYHKCIFGKWFGNKDHAWLSHWLVPVTNQWSRCSSDQHVCSSWKWTNDVPSLLASGRLRAIRWLRGKRVFRAIPWALSKFLCRSIWYLNISGRKIIWFEGFYLKNIETTETRTVTQFHFLTWEEFSNPPSMKTFLDFRR